MNIDVASMKIIEAHRIGMNGLLWFRYSTENHLVVRAFVSDHSSDDPCCADITDFVGLLERLPRDFDFITEEQRSIIETINHPTLISEEQLYDNKKGVPKTLKSFLTDLLKTYSELGT